MFLSWTSEKREVSPANNLGLEEKSSDRHSWQRGPNSLFYKALAPPILPTPFFKFCPTPLPVTSNPHPHYTFCCLVSLAESVLRHIWRNTLLNNIMDVHMSSLRTLMCILCNKASSFIVCLRVSNHQKHYAPLFCQAVP